MPFSAANFLAAGLAKARSLDPAAAGVGKGAILETGGGGGLGFGAGGGGAAVTGSDAGAAGALPSARGS